jgi:hypothetical protein
MERGCVPPGDFVRVACKGVTGGLRVRVARKGVAGREKFAREEQYSVEMGGGVFEWRLRVHKSLYIT